MHSPFSGFECASEFTLNLETKQVAVVNEYTNQRCTAFATDYVQDGILYRFGGFTPLGETSDKVSVSYQDNTSGEFESSISFSLYIPRIAKMNLESFRRWKFMVGLHFHTLPVTCTLTSRHSVPIT